MSERKVRNSYVGAATRHCMGSWRATAGDGRECELELPGVPSSLAGAESVEYRTTLSDPRDPTDDIAVLTLRGLYAQATVDLPGRLDGDGPVEHDVYFTPLRLPFVPDGPTDVELSCRAPTDRFGGSHDTDRVPDEQTVPGVWRDISLETGPLPYLESVAVRPERGESGPQLRVRTSVLTGGPTTDRLSYTVRPAGDSRGGGTMERSRIETDTAGRTVVEHTVALRSPALWWPRGFGDQNRHVLRVALGEQERTTTVGICDVTVEDGSVLVNDEPIPIRGVNLVDGRAADVDRALELNATLVRARAHVPPEPLYDACDEAGLLVWQDLPLAGPGPYNTERGRTLARALTRQTARHPSVAVYAAHSEPTAVASGLGGGLLDRLRLRWQARNATYDAASARELAAALPDPSFPAVGGPGLGCDAAAYYPGWRYGTPDDIGWLLARYPTEILAAYGAPAPAGNPEDRTDATPVVTRSIAGVDDPIAARAAQAGLLGRVTERLRRERVGAVACCLRDAGEAGFGVYERDGEPKPARDTLARAFEPVQAFLVEPSAGVNRVVVVNDTTGQVSGTLRWRAGDTGGTLDLTVESRGHWENGSLQVPPDADRIGLELVSDSHRVENRYALDERV
jgi:hypothetical protein